MIRKELASILSLHLNTNVNENSNIKKDDIQIWDSLKHIEIIMSIEEHFNISFRPEDIPFLTSQDKIVKYIEDIKNV